MIPAIFKVDLAFRKIEILLDNALFYWLSQRNVIHPVRKLFCGTPFSKTIILQYFCVFMCEFFAMFEVCK